MINWDSIIKNLKDGTIVTVDPDRWDSSNSEYKQMLDLWKSKNFNTDAVRWKNYYEYGNLEYEIADMLSIKPIRSWISCVEPGYMTGYHYDIDDREQEYLKIGHIKRYTIFISEPDIGHLFILGKNYYYNQSQGTILKWNHYRDWHAGINGGLSNKYMFHFLGH
jgi:hypothetical protein